MRILRACLAAAALVAAGGCLGDGGGVTLTFGSQMSVSPALTNFTAGDATANTSSDGVVHFTATSPQGTLTMDITGILHAGDTFSLMEEHNSLSFDVTGAGWSSNGGIIEIDGVSPYKVRFTEVPMLSGSGAAMGSFVIDGTGTFK